VIWFVYLVEGRGQLYCGITTDVKRRVNEHNNSKCGSKWCRAHRPVKLVWNEEVIDKSAALKRECEIKKMKTKEKRKLIKEK